ncbi:hypothetical protein WMY93_006914 [Mugilogobius chulae]|uniref:Uncharacterized protein n=1 Tax=Mugilogobius chulae TaxID=88201 RepID=A0AAW0PWQ7_9GOBI
MRLVAALGRARERESVNSGEYALQMCRPVTLQVYTPALTDTPALDGRTVFSPESTQRQAGGREGGKREGHEPGASHPEDLCSLAGRTAWNRTEEREREGEVSIQRRRRGACLLNGCVPPHVASSCTLSEFTSGTDLRAPGSKLKHELKEKKDRK